MGYTLSPSRDVGSLIWFTQGEDSIIVPPVMITITCISLIYIIFSSYSFTTNSIPVESVPDIREQSSAPRGVIAFRTSVGVGCSRPTGAISLSVNW